MRSFELTLTGNEGLHARPAAELARIASTQGVAVTIGRLGQPGVAAGSILGLLSLGLRSGERVLLTVDGATEDSVAQQISELLGK
ncbi:MAG: HPr family phosphocarrier protein [Actinomycetales bacterium]|nr:HPr family phosphocarrier protein [Actinomycetales bacterium]